MTKLTTITLLLLSFTFYSDSNWKLEKDKNGIRVLTHIPENSELKEIRMTSTANATLTQAIAVLMDVEGYPNWIYNCESAKVVKDINENEIVYYSITKAPWPVLDRDLVVYNKIYQHPETKEVFSKSEAKAELLPLVNGRIRITDMLGLWKFTPKGSNKIEIEYYIKVDPAGKLPTWVVNMFIANGPYQSMLKFKEQLQKEKYKNAKIDFIKD